MTHKPFDLSAAQPRRRSLARLLALAAAPWVGQTSAQNAVPVSPPCASAAAELVSLWRREGGALLVRHAATEAGLGDPPGFVIGQCRTQRNLSEAGRQASVAWGAWMRAQALAPAAVRSSQWCRCQDTARLAFGQFEDWPALNSTFAGQGNPKAQLQALRDRLLAMPAGRKEVWVTHQVIMTGLTGAYPGLGEAFLVDRQGRLLVRADVAA
jgi:phosphohistidine phosphatase SixA